MRVDPRTGSKVHEAQANGAPTHNAPYGELVTQRLAPAQGEEDIETTPRGGDSGTIRGEPGQVDVAGEEEHGGEEHGQGLEGPAVKGDDECRQSGGWHG